ncbi:MBG domain-containing protein [Flavitalea sp.]|nr:MBG domain-containing protein [Flavitalea sp.]
MRWFFQAIQNCSFLLLFSFFATISQGQTPIELRIKDFAVWGGSASPNSYNSSQGVFIGNAVSIQGNVGSNHLIDANNLFSISGNIYSGNIISLGNLGKITGNVFAAKKAPNYNGNVISADYRVIITGNLTAQGKIVLKSLGSSLATSVTGQVSVPSPTATNYSGPVPTGGIDNLVALPVMPAMPNNTAFDNQAGTTNITNTQTISPGKYRKLALTGDKTLTFNGPGNYIFEEVDNKLNSNKLVYDFKNTATGSINIFIIKDAKWGRLSVKTVNGNFPSRIYTEIHGTGSTNSGKAFSIIGPVLIPNNSYVWLGNIWAPNGGIEFKSLNPFNTPHVLGALWSAKRIELDQNLKLVYQATAVGTGPGYIDPYYPPPPNGKVAAANNKIGAELISLTQNTAAISAIPDNEMFILDGTGNVKIEVISKQPNDNTLKGQLVTLGMTGIIDNGPHLQTITGDFPVNKISQLAGNTRIEYVRPLYPPISNTGFINSQGDMTMRSNSVRDRFGLTGSNIKIGVISDSYDAKAGAQTDVNEGDLPGVKSNGQPGENPDPVQVVEDLAQRGNDEGRAMLQIVHDVAPKAKLAFHTGFLSAGHFAAAIQKLASPSLPGGRCDIIVDDLTYITEPFQRDGVVARAVNEVVSQGVTYFTSAGNFGDKSYESVFNGVTNTSVMPTGQIHRFGANAADLYQTINLKPGSYTIALQWSDEFKSLGSTNGVQTDLDLYLVSANGFQLFGFNRSNLFGDPFEICAFTVKDTTNAKLMIVRAAGTSNVRFKYVIFRGEPTILDYKTGTSTVVGHANSDSAISVGAMLYGNVPPFTPVWPGVASFSSRGGTVTLRNNTFSTRNKPDLIGPNGVNTSVNLGGQPFNDGDIHPNFFGTSAAAPHVAAVAALLMEGRKKFNLQTTVTPYEIRQQLISSAGKFSYLPGNFSFEGGYGYVQADSAMVKIANGRPIISTLTAVNPGAQNGTQPFMVKITGRYLAANTQIYVNNSPVPTTISINPATGIGTATATVPAIPNGQDPTFQLYSPPKSPSGLDGGKSESLQFFSAGVKVIVRPENKSRRYGQENPAFHPGVSVVIGSDTSDISQTSLSLADLKLDNLVFATNALPLSSPRAYAITVERATLLPANDPLNAQYTFIFAPGTLTVERMTLKITPKDKVIKYGDDLTGIEYTYDLDQNGVNSPQLLEEVKSLHRKYLADNGLIVLNGVKAINPLAAPLDLSNVSAMASFQSVRNARKFVVENGQLRALVNNLDVSQIGEQRFIVDVSAQSLLNYKTDSAKSIMVEALANQNARALLNVKALTSGKAEAAVPGGDLQPMVNGQLLAMVNGQLKALVNGQLKALVNNVTVDVTDISFLNGQLLALVNGVWEVVPNAQLLAIVNGQEVTVDLSIANGQLKALVNGEEMSLVNGQLQAIVNGQLLALVNGQLKALVNGQLTPLINGQLMAIVNGEIGPLTNGQLLAIVNGQLMVLENGELEVAEDLQLANGQLKALVNGQLKALVNGQLKALVNGEVTDVPTTSFTIVNGQLQALVNGQQVAYVNGQLLALVNGQLKALVNGSGVSVQSVKQFANGQLKALVNGSYIPIANGQLQALVNGQLLAMVNGQLMALVNGELTFAIFANGQLKALVNGQFEPFTNGQLKAIVNGQLAEVNSYTIANGQLKAIVNGEEWVYPNGQLKALVNGQLQALVNNFDVGGANNNTKTMVVVDEDDINLQAGDVGGMFSMNMITGLEAGYHNLFPGAFVNENFEVTYGASVVLITKKPLSVTAENKTKNPGEVNPPLTVTYNGFAYNETESDVCQPVVFPPTTKVIDQVERRTTYTNVLVNATSNVYHATPGEELTLTATWNQVYFSDFIPGYVQYCPGCITQSYIGMANDQFTGNIFDICSDVSGTEPHAGLINQTFTAPTRPGVYYITQQSSYWFSCYQFGHLFHDQDATDAIAVVIVLTPGDESSGAVTPRTTASIESPPGDYPIVIGGCYFNSNYRIVYKDGTLTVNEAVNLKSAPKTVVAAKVVTEKPAEAKARIDMIYPNPASSVLRLQVKGDLQNVRDIRIYDGLGKPKAAPLRKISEGIYEINVSGLSNGIHIIEARTAAGTKTFKFIKI